MKKKIKSILTIALFFGIGIAASMLNYHKYQATVKALPKIKNMGWLEACLANHCSDWFFYFYPAVGIFIITTMFTLFGIMIVLYKY